MRRTPAALLFGLAMFTMCGSAGALEKRTVPVADREDQWNASGATCRTSYYNICTGWVWIWSGFGDGGRLGTVFSTGGMFFSLLQTSVFVATGAPSGYGFTGTIAVHNVDANDCPAGPTISSQPFLPTSAFHLTLWGGLPIPSEFALIVTTEENLGLPNPAAFGTDHPAAGPTGPQACGACYPLSRVNHSFA